jgi:hypothetical protein
LRTSSSRGANRWLLCVEPTKSATLVLIKFTKLDDVFHSPLTCPVDSTRETCIATPGNGEDGSEQIRVGAQENRRAAFFV